MLLPDEPTPSFPYRIEEKIGEGSMGTVFRARDDKLDRRVAIKTLQQDVVSELSEKEAREISKRFLQEARAAARLEHSGVASIYQMGVEQGAAFIAMEWLEGETLREIIETRAPLDPEFVRDVGLELLDILADAHDNGIVHRDLKPANIIVSGGVPRLTDFGVAHVGDSKLIKTQAGSMLGTPAYASPEQIRDDEIDPRADLYAVGVLMFEMATGTLPIEGDNVASFLNNILEAEPPSPSDIVDIPEALDHCIMHALRKDRSERFRSAEHMRVTLQRHWESASEASETSQVGEDSIEFAQTVLPVEEQGRTIVVSGRTSADMVVQTVRRWEGRPLGMHETDALFDELLDAPIHAEPFAGGVEVGSSLFLVCEGLVFGAIDLDSGETGDVVYESLPPHADVTLYEVPDSLPDRIVMNLSSVLYPPDRLHSDLDTSFTDVNQLVERLCEETFSGTVTFEGDDKRAHLSMHRGTLELEIFSETWSPDPTETPWPEWIHDESVKAHVEKRRTILLSLSYEMELADQSFEVEPNDESLDDASSADRLRRAHWHLEPAEEEHPKSAERSSAMLRNLYSSDRMCNCLRWILHELPSFLDDRDRFPEWKYLSHWIGAIRRATLYHDLPRPSGTGEDTFDLVTFDAEDKVLHLADRYSRVTADRLEAFTDKVTEAKEARMDRGDIGGALLLGSEFTSEAQETYRELIRRENDSWLFNLQDSMTGYEGFVRIGTRRGFHLLLLEVRNRGFQPHLPSSI